MTLTLVSALDLPHMDITDSVALVTGANGGLGREFTHQLLAPGSLDDLRAELDTHFWRTLHMTRAFAPALAAQGAGAGLDLSRPGRSVPWHRE